MTDLCALLHNDLERVTIGRHPELAEIKRQLLDLGAAGALMSGSGSTVFALFAEAAAADAAQAALQHRADWRVLRAEPV